MIIQISSLCIFYQKLTFDRNLINIV